jgi:putative ABC transport system permease protein
LLGCVIAEIGLVALTPAIIAEIGRFAWHLPTSPRFALRDAGRNRARAGTAAAAVLAAVAGASAVAVYASSQSADGAAHFVPEIPLGQVFLHTNMSTPMSRVPDVSKIVHALPMRSVVTVVGLDFDSNAAHECNPGTCAGGWRAVAPPGVKTQCGQGMDFSVWPCTQSFGAPWSGLLVGAAATYRAVTGVELPAAQGRELAKGRALISGDLTHYIDSRGFIKLARFDAKASVELPAVAFSGQTPQVAGRYTALIPPKVASRLGLMSHAQGVMVITTRMPTAAELASATNLGGSTSPALLPLAGTPYQAASDAPLLMIFIAAVVLAIVATAVATGLANADAQPDLATMEAVGATPHIRRVVAASSAAVVALVGTVLGALAGVVVGGVATHATFDPYVPMSPSAPRLAIAIPWGHLVGLWLVVPVIAIVSAFVFTRGRLPMVRRLT